MQVKDIMSENPTYIAPSATLKKAAEKMEELDCGFLAIGDEQEDKLCGVITDRDITIRAVAKGLNPETTKVEDVQTEKVLYCFEGDSVEDTADNMHNNQVYRLIVLNNANDKRLCGVVTLGDVVRHDNTKAAEKAAQGISAAQQQAA